MIIPLQEVSISTTFGLMNGNYKTNQYYEEIFQYCVAYCFMRKHTLRKPYVRPIVRGKEVNSVEFGAKVNNILVDGISFIEKLSFNAFNEGTRLIYCLKMHKRLFGVEAKKVGGDTGYAGPDNRDYCKENGIQTSFVKRGQPFSEDKMGKDLVRQELARVRATAMEGSFGTQKEHYDMRRVKAVRS